jgi:hypothetical protein
MMVSVSFHSISAVGEIRVFDGPLKVAKFCNVTSGIPLGYGPTEL